MDMWLSCSEESHLPETGREKSVYKLFLSNYDCLGS